MPGGRIVLDQQYGSHHLPLCRRTSAGQPRGEAGGPLLLP
jgi:hypothetical protein